LYCGVDSGTIQLYNYVAEAGKEKPVKQRMSVKLKKNPLYKSFGYAFQGIWACIRRERNIKIHLGFMTLVIIAGCVLHISMTEWMICMILFAQVLSLEIVNTAIEACIDLVSPERQPLAKLAKDAAAGAVLISAIFAAIIGLLIFVPKVF
jgi:diacylglycerol kinase